MKIYVGFVVSHGAPVTRLSPSITNCRSPLHMHLLAQNHVDGITRDAPSLLQRTKSSAHIPKYMTVRAIPPTLLHEFTYLTFISFAKNKQYTFVHPSCLAAASLTPTYYSTWTSLQHHVWTAHPPTCPHSSCSGGTFASHHGLRAPLKLRDEREVETGSNEVDRGGGGW